MYMEEEQWSWMNQSQLKAAQPGALRDGIHLSSDEGLDFHI